MGFIYFFENNDNIFGESLSTTVNPRDLTINEDFNLNAKDFNLDAEDSQLYASLEFR